MDCKALGCKIEEIDRCAVCGQPVIRTTHNQEAHRSQDDYLAVMSVAYVETVELSCTGAKHIFRSLSHEETMTP